MHQPIKDSLEEYLKGSARQVSQDFHAHLEKCAECASELRLLETQANMLRLLRSEDLAPSPGFYARVMERIEERGRASVWAVFLQPRFGRSLAIASAALVVLLGTYLVATEPGDRGFTLAPAVVSADLPPAQTAVPGDTTAGDTAQQQRERNAVLVDLASYH